MQLTDRLVQAIRGVRRPTERLADFSFAGRIGPVLALAAVALFMYGVSGYGSSLRLMLSLCAAYAVAFVMLAILRLLRGPDAPWSLILPTAVVGVVAGAYASAAIAQFPEWAALLSWRRIQTDWQIGAAFGAFFVGLSLMTAAVRQRDQAEFATRQRLLEARVNMLAARIEPHFLMNTLANLRYLVRSDTKAAYAMLEHLSDFLQGALERSRDLESTLGQEIQLVDSYLAIMQIRLGEKLGFRVEIPEPLSRIPFPALLVQTLVENAVAHGIEPGDGNGRITVTACERDGQVEVTVEDNGVGFDPGAVRDGGLGLQNVRERLETLYGDRASLQIVSSPGTGTRAVVTIPREKH